MVSTPDSGLAMTEAASRNVGAGCAGAAAGSGGTRSRGSARLRCRRRPAAGCAPACPAAGIILSVSCSMSFMFVTSVSQKWLVALLVIVLVDWLPPPAPAPGPAPRPGSQSGSKNRCAGRVAIHVDVIDLVNAQIGRVGHHRQVGAVDFIAHVHLLGDAIEQLRQRLVDGVERDAARDAGMNVDVELGIAREREQQLLHLDVVDHYAIGLGPRSGLGLGQYGRDPHRFGDFARRRRSRGLTCPGEGFIVCMAAPAMSRQAPNISPTLRFISLAIDIYMVSPSGLYSTTAAAQSLRLTRNASNAATCISDPTGNPWWFWRRRAVASHCNARESKLALMHDSPTAYYCTRCWLHMD